MISKLSSHLQSGEKKKKTTSCIAQMQTSATLQTRFHSRLSTDAARCWLCCWLPWCPPEESFQSPQPAEVLTVCEATLTLKTSAVILAHAGGEGRFRRSGITETFGITIKRKTDVDAASNVEKNRRVQNRTTQSSFPGKICILLSRPCSLFSEEYILYILYPQYKITLHAFRLILDFLFNLFMQF